MPKLLQINVTANWGSTGVIAESIGLAAKQRGWVSYIAFGRCSQHSQSYLIKVGSRIETYLHYAKQRILDSEGLGSFLATKRLIWQIKTIKPDIVHLHNIHDHYLNYRLLFEYLNQSEIKVVWTLHDFWPVTGHCMHFTSVACERFRTGCYDCPMKNIYPKSLLERSTRNYVLKRRLFSANSHLTIVPVSDWVCSEIKASFLANKTIVTIPNGIDTTVFKPTTPRKSQRRLFSSLENKFVILSVASQWAYDKGLEDYKKLSGLLQDDEIIVLVGVTNEIMVSLPHNIVGVKRTESAEELAALYTRADVVTILSSAETFGLTVVEGYACGTPAVVYDNTAPPTLITAATGLVATNQDYRSAYAAIQEIRRIGKDFYSASCMALARTKYNKDVCFQKYVDLYERLVTK